MNWITVSWLVIASACVTLACVHLLVWWQLKAHYDHLLFAILAAAVGVFAVFELSLFGAWTVEEFTALQRWIHVPVFATVAGSIWFLHFFFGSGRLWLAVLTTAMYALLLVINFAAPVSMNYLAILALQPIELWGGVPVPVPVGIVNPWSRIEGLTLSLWAAYVADASSALWRRRDPVLRRRAVRVGGSLLLLVLIAAPMSQLIHEGILRLPYLMAWLILGPLLAMAYELGRQVVRAAQLGQEVQRGQRQLVESEERLRLATEAANVGMWIWHIRDDEIWASNQCHALLGLDPAEKLTFERFLATLHAGDREATRRAVEHAHGGTGTYETEFRAVVKERGIRWFSARGQTEFGAAGEPLRMRGVVLDVTDQKQAAERFRVVVEAAPNAMIMTTAEGRIALLNRQAERVFGYSREELIEQPIEVLVPEGLRHAHPRHRDGYVQDAQARAMGAGRELFALRKGGALFPVEIGLNPIETPEGLSVLASIIDITERKRAEQEAAERRNELAHLARVAMLGELSGALAHELNQPLTAILSNAQAARRFLAQGPSAIEEVIEILGDIVEDDKRAGEVIRRLRSLLKKEDPQFLPLDLNAVVADVLRLVRSDLLNRSVKVRTQLQARLPTVKGDVVQLQQVLLNLILNACDAMQGCEPGQRELTIRTQAGDEREVGVEVADQGTGIASADLDAIFDPFVTTKASGMGLGLAVCRTIIQAHGGAIAAANNPERGACLRFTLPVNGTKV